MECERLVSNWLLELYQVKQEIVSTFDAQLEKAQNQELHNKIEREIEDILSQSDLIKGRLEEMDRDILASNSDLVNWVKDTQSFASGREEDQILRFANIKHVLSYLERTMIKTISLAAEECNDQRTLDLCKKLSDQEVQADETLDQEIHEAIIDIINRSAPEKTHIDIDEGQF